MKQTVLFLIITIISFFEIKGQNKDKIDSLYKVLNESKADTIKLSALFKLANEYYLSSPDSAIALCNKALNLAQKTNDKKAIGEAYGWLGYLISIKGESAKALDYYNHSLKVRQEIGDNDGIAIALNNIGYTYRVLGNIPKALESYSQSLKIYEKNKNYQGIAEAYNNLSSLYIYVGDTSKSVELHKKSLELYKKVNDKHGIATTLLWFGFISKNQGKYNEALDYFNQSLDIQIEINDIYGKASTYNNIGIIYQYLKNDKLSLEYFDKSLKLREEIGDKQGMSFTLTNIASINFKNNQIEKALNDVLKAYKISKEIGYIDNIERAAGLLKQIYARKGDYKKAFDFYKEEIVMRDSVLNKENFRKAQKQQAQYDYEKKAAIDSIAHAKEMKIKNLEINKEKAIADRQRIIIWFIISGLIFVIGFLFVLFRMFIQKKKANQLLSKQNIEIKAQKEEISTQRDEIRTQRDIVIQQKEHIEHIHHKLTDSINYAKKIQDAVLPSSDSYRAILEEHFILYMPKDIVSGDFYWGTKLNDWLIVAVADCTGHGVPGGFMSMLGISFLNEIVAKKEIIKTDEILNEMRKEIISALQQKNMLSEQKDGMDIAIVAINKTTNICQYSGANNPLYIVKSKKVKGESSENNEPELLEIKPDKMPVAIHPIMNNFTYNELRIEKGDILYLFSDGYADQFGGKSGKKFMYKKFKELLITVSQKPANEQQQVLENNINEWIGNSEQTDDITVVGIKI